MPVVPVPPASVPSAPAPWRIAVSPLARRWRPLLAAGALAVSAALFVAGPASAASTPPGGATASSAPASSETSSDPASSETPSPADTIGHVASAEEMAPLRDAWTKQLESGWKSAGIYVDDSVTAGLTADQRRQIQASIDAAKAQGVPAHVALLPEAANSDAVVADQLDGPALGAIQKVAAEQRLSGIFVILTTTDYGRWSSYAFTIDKDGIPSGSLVGYRQTGRLDDENSGAVGSYSVDAGLASIRGRDLPDPTDAQVKSGFDSSQIQYYMPTDSNDPNALVVLLTLIAGIGSVLFVALRAGSRRGPRLTVTELPESLRKKATAGVAAMRALGEKTAEAPLPEHVPASGAPEEDRFEARAELERELDALLSLPEPEDISDPREMAAVMALSARIRHHQGVVAGETMGPPRAVCFYNPLHTLSVDRLGQRVLATMREPDALETRALRPGVVVPVCARCAKAHDEQGDFDTLNVRFRGRVVPYWNTGDPVYAATGFGAFGDLAEAVLARKAGRGTARGAAAKGPAAEAAEDPAERTPATTGRAGAKRGTTAAAAPRGDRRVGSGIAIVLGSILAAAIIGVAATTYLIRGEAGPGVDEQTSAATIPDYDATRVDRLAASLQHSPVVVDPPLLVAFPAADQRRIAEKIRDSGKPIYVVGASSNAYDESRGDADLFARRVASKLTSPGVVIALDGREISVGYQRQDVDEPLDGDYDDDDSDDSSLAVRSSYDVVSREIDALTAGTWSGGPAADVGTPGEDAPNRSYDDEPKTLLFGYPLGGYLSAVLVGGLVGALIGWGVSAGVLAARNRKPASGTSGRPKNKQGQSRSKSKQSRSKTEQSRSKSKQKSTQGKRTKS